MVSRRPRAGAMSSCARVFVSVNRSTDQPYGSRYRGGGQRELSAMTAGRGDGEQRERCPHDRETDQRGRGPRLVPDENADQELDRRGEVLQQAEAVEWH